MGKKSRLKNQPTVQAPQKPSPVQEMLPKVIFAGLLLLLFYPPYFRAMFFTKEQLPTHIFTLILFILWWVVKYQRNDSTFLSSPLDYFVFGFALMYFLTLPIAINKRGAIQEFLKVTNYFLVYWLAKEFSQTKKQANIILNVLVFSALGVAILGLGAAAGTWEVHGGYKGGRIFSTIQYPNSLAAYLTGAFFVTLGLLQNASLKLRRIYIASAFLLILTILLTYSRGGWLLLPVFSLAYLIATPRSKKTEAVFTMGIVYLVSIAAMPVLARLYTSEKGMIGWLVIFSGIAVVILLQYLLLESSLSKKPIIIYGTIVGIFCLLLAGAGVYASRTLTKPILLAHTATEAESSKMLNEQVKLIPGKEYTLTFELLAQGEVPYAWRVTGLGRDREGNSVTIFDQYGKATEGWEPVNIVFTTPENNRHSNIRLLNYYTGSSMEIRNVTLSAPGFEKKLAFAWNRLLPATLYSRVFGFSASDINVVTRFRYAQDAFEIIKDYPLFGLGGHGWKSRYFQYQSAGYSSTEVHNHFIQVWVETGILGFFLFIGIWLSFLITAYQLYKDVDEEKRVIAVSVATGVFAVVSHSLYDFNLSLGAIGIFLWALLGVIRGSALKTSLSSLINENKSVFTGLAIGFASVLLLFVTSLQIGYTAHENGLNYLRSNQPRNAVTSLKQAVKYDGYNTDYRISLADAYEGLFIQEQDRTYLDKVDEQLSKAVSFDRFHPRSYNRYGTFLVRSGRFDEGLTVLNESIELQPWLADHYNIYARTSLNVASYLLSSQNQATAEPYILQALAIEERLKPYAKDTKKLSFAMGQAHYMLGNLKEAESYLLSAYQVPEDQALSAMILSLIFSEKGDTAKAKEYYDKAERVEPASVNFYQEMKEI